MRRFYSIKGEGADECHELAYFRAILEENGDWEKLELVAWKANIPGDGTFWCKKDGEGYDSSESYCGSQCNSYVPRNGTSGRCRWHAPTYSPTDETKTIFRRRPGPNIKNKSHHTTKPSFAEDPSLPRLAL